VDEAGGSRGVPDVLELRPLSGLFDSSLSPAGHARILGVHPIIPGRVTPHRKEPVYGVEDRCTAPQDKYVKEGLPDFAGGLPYG
jgi:hypothetical protein